MKEYTIEWLERKTTSTGKAYMQITLEGEGEKKVSIWSDFPDFANIMPGGKVSGELKQNDKGYWNLYPPRTGAKPNGGAFKQKVIEEAQARKAGDIERFQGNKEEAIRIQSAQRDAVLIVTQLQRDLITENEIKEAIVAWRNWFLSDDFKEHPPF